MSISAGFIKSCTSSAGWRSDQGGQGTYHRPQSLLRERAEAKKRKVQAANAKEVGLGKPAEETSSRLNSHEFDSPFATLQPGTLSPARQFHHFFSLGSNFTVKDS